MPKLTRFFGADQVDRAGNNTQRDIGRGDGSARGASPVWPDIDGVFSGGLLQLGRRYEQEAQARSGRAVALSAYTDWDAVNVFFDGDSEPYMLLPGQVLRRSFDRIKALPILRAPATRLGPNPRAFSNALPDSQLQGLRIIMIDPQDGFGLRAAIKNFGPNLTVYAWTGTGWNNQGSVVASGAIVCFVGETRNGGPTPRPADLSFDRKFNLADYVTSGGIRNNDGLDGPPAVPPTVYAGLIYASTKAQDSNGSLGDAADPAMLLYPDVWNRPTPVSPIWLGRLALDIWTEQEPDCSYAPRLPSCRVVQLPAFTLPIEAVADTPDQQIMVVPSLNVRSAQFTFRSGGPGAVDAVLGSPLPDEPLDAPAKVRSEVSRGANGDGAAAALFEEIQPFLSVIVGGTLANTVLKQGAMLVLKREQVG